MVPQASPPAFDQAAAAVLPAGVAVQQGLICKISGPVENSPGQQSLPLTPRHPFICDFIPINIHSSLQGFGCRDLRQKGLNSCSMFFEKGLESIGAFAPPPELAAKL